MALVFGPHAGSLTSPGFFDYFAIEAENAHGGMALECRDACLPDEFPVAVAGPAQGAQPASVGAARSGAAALALLVALSLARLTLLD